MKDLDILPEPPMAWGSIFSLPWMYIMILALSCFEQLANCANTFSLQENYPWSTTLQINSTVNETICLAVNHTFHHDILCYDTSKKGFLCGAKYQPYCEAQMKSYSSRKNMDITFRIHEVQKWLNLSTMYICHMYDNNYLDLKNSCGKIGTFIISAGVPDQPPSDKPTTGTSPMPAVSGVTKEGVPDQPPSDKPTTGTSPMPAVSGVTKEGVTGLGRLILTWTGGCILLVMMVLD